MTGSNHLYKPPAFKTHAGSSCLDGKLSGSAAVGKFGSNKRIGARPPSSHHTKCRWNQFLIMHFKFKGTAGMASFMFLLILERHPFCCITNKTSECTVGGALCFVLFFQCLTCVAVWPSRSSQPDVWMVAMTSVSCRVSLHATCRTRPFLPLLSMAALGTEDPTTCDQMACLQQIMSLILLGWALIMYCLLWF